MSSKPKLRREFEFDIECALRLLLRQYEGRSVIQSCISCTNFDHPKELCKLCGLRPPADVIAYGCAKYSDDTEIPF